MLSYKSMSGFFFYFWVNMVTTKTYFPINTSCKLILCFMNIRTCSSAMSLSSDFFYDSFKKIHQGFLSKGIHIGCGCPFIFSFSSFFDLEKDGRLTHSWRTANFHYFCHNVMMVLLLRQ